MMSQKKKIISKKLIKIQLINLNKTIKTFFQIKTIKIKVYNFKFKVKSQKIKTMTCYLVRIFSTMNKSQKMNNNNLYKIYSPNNKCKKIKINYWKKIIRLKNKFQKRNNK